MDEKIITACIAGVVALAVSLLGYFSTRSALRAKQRENEYNLKNNYMEKLYELRLQHYPDALDISKSLTRAPKNGRTFEREHVLDVRNKVANWMNSKGGLIASALIQASYELRDRLGANFGDNEAYSKEQMEKIILAVTNIRRELRSDIRFIHNTDVSRIRDIG